MATSPLARGCGAVKPPPGTPLDPSHPLAQGLVGCWLLNEGAGAVAADASGRRHTGAVGAGGGWGAGRSGPALTCDGVSPHIPVNVGAPDAGITSALTAEIIALSSVTQVHSPMGNNGGATDKATVEFFDNNGAPWARVYSTADAAGAGTTLTAGTWPAGVWQHLVVTWDGATARLYQNGAQVASASKSGAPGNLTNAYALGARVATPGSNFTYSGRLAKAALYARALTAAEVRALYAAPYQMFLTGASRYFFLGGAAWSQALTDAFAVSDALTRGSAKSLSDASALSDALAKAFTRAAMAETWPLADAATRGAGKAAPEPWALTDSRTSGAAKSASDTFPLSDARTAGAGKSAAETWALADARAMGIGPHLAESLTLADGRTLGVGKAVAEALSLADARSADARRQLADTLALAESLARSAGFARTLADALDISDALAATLARVLAFALRGQALPGTLAGLSAGLAGTALAALLTGTPLPPSGAESLDGTPLE